MSAVSQSNREKVSEALKSIENKLNAINTDKDWLDFLKFQSMFHNYSVNNTILIYLQRPEATFVAGFNTWKKMNRFVKKGAKGIQILAPCIYKKKDENGDVIDDEKVLRFYKAVYVFDLADTDGEDFALPTLIGGLHGDSAELQELYERLLDYIRIDCAVTEDTGFAAKGYFTPSTNSITINSEYDTLQKIKTLLHEYGHCMDHQMNTAEGRTTAEKELVAESVAYVIASALGLDTSSYSVSYINAWSNKITQLKTVAKSVQVISERILSLFESRSTEVQEESKEVTDNKAKELAVF